MKPFRDSLADPLSGKRIDYRVDTAGRRMVRIRETRSPGTTFLLGENDPSLLRLRQEAVYILLAEKKDRFSRLTIVLNRYSDLESWVAGGINAKMDELDHPAYLIMLPASITIPSWLRSSPSRTI